MILYVVIRLIKLRYMKCELISHGKLLVLYFLCKQVNVCTIWYKKNYTNRNNSIKFIKRILKATYFKLFRKYYI